MSGLIIFGAALTHSGELGNTSSPEALIVRLVAAGMSQYASEHATATITNWLQISNHLNWRAIAGYSKGYSLPPPWSHYVFVDNVPLPGAAQGNLVLIRTVPTESSSGQMGRHGVRRVGMEFFYTWLDEPVVKSAMSKAGVTELPNHDAQTSGMVLPEFEAIDWEAVHRDAQFEERKQANETAVPSKRPLSWNGPARQSGADKLRNEKAVPRSSGALAGSQNRSMNTFLRWLGIGLASSIGLALAIFLFRSHK